MSKLDELKQTFFDECDEALQQIESGLTEMRNESASGETINAIFRGVHSVKGGAGIFGFEPLVEFAHAFETVLDKLRHNQLASDAQTLDVLLTANDVLSDLIRLSRSGEAIPASFGAECRASLDTISGVKAAAPGEDSEQVAPADFDGIDFTPVMADLDHEAGTNRSYRFVLAPANGISVDAAALIDAFESAASAGELSFEADLSSLPSAASLEVGRPRLAWNCVLSTGLDRPAVAALFETLQSAYRISFEEADDATADPPVAAPAEDVIAAAALMRELSVAAEPPPPNLKDEVAKASSQLQKAPAGTTTRIELDKIDRAVNLVGELVIAQAMLGQIANELPEQTYTRLVQSIQEVTHHTRELKDSVMSMRAQQVGAVFQRMPRLVRELSAKTGKKVKLELAGEKTEVDRTIIERLADPLTHIIRNSVDHGIESIADRVAAGKPEEGTVRLTAEQRGGRIVIEIRDDGAGINSERVLQKARARGLVGANAVLSEDETNALIMLPGFSTAETISDISGRGVGMDVVRASIAEIGGRVTLKSERGRGLTIQLSLPLTLAVMDGMVIKARHEIYVVPLSAIVECLLPDRATIGNLIGTQGILQLRGEHIPLVKLSELFSLQSAEQSETDGVVIVTDAGDGNRIGIVVDELCGHQQVVIKSIEESYGSIPGIAAATILGNGRVALILDIEKLGDMAIPEQSNVPRAA